MDSFFQFLKFPVAAQIGVVVGFFILAISWGYGAFAVKNDKKDQASERAITNNITNNNNYGTQHFGVGDIVTEKPVYFDTKAARVSVETIGGKKMTKVEIPQAGSLWKSPFLEIKIETNIPADDLELSPAGCYGGAVQNYAEGSAGPNVKYIRIGQAPAPQTPLILYLSAKSDVQVKGLSITPGNQ